jgi:hypothetical protein
MKCCPKWPRAYERRITGAENVGGAVGRDALARKLNSGNIIFLHGCGVEHWESDAGSGPAQDRADFVDEDGIVAL